jgi:hypothetical protein
MLLVFEWDQNVVTSYVYHTVFLEDYRQTWRCQTTGGDGGRERFNDQQISNDLNG